MSPLPTNYFQKRAVNKAMNRCIRTLLEDNPTEPPKVILEAFFLDNVKHLDGFTKEYMYNNLDNKTKKMLEERQKQFKDELMSP